MLLLAADSPPPPYRMLNSAAVAASNNNGCGSGLHSCAPMDVDNVATAQAQLPARLPAGMSVPSGELYLIFMLHTMGK